MTHAVTAVALGAALVMVSISPGQAKPPAKPAPTCTGIFTDICQPKSSSGAGGYKVSPSGTIVFSGDRITGTRPGGGKPGGNCKGKRC
ncbi:hypothetical protein ACQVP2_21855 [Methylobacterium aquaticum]|uniref:hypothetical protein n=1 Tax=Methylobacterium aquaticum TaxID=270351 RepID=UPI000A81BA7D|nr:hypothetical protein [Methylobacterium aquaticum]